MTDFRILNDTVRMLYEKYETHDDVNIKYDIAIILHSIKSCELSLQSEMIIGREKAITETRLKMLKEFQK